MTLNQFTILLAMLRRLLLIATFVLWPSMLSAQHSHGATSLTPSVTFPQDDAVLLEQPQMLVISFRVNVQLLKLALYTDKGDWIDLGFQWDPSQSDNNFVFPIPTELPGADYYVAQWSVVDETQRFMKGKFSFSFGADALAPSETIEGALNRRDDSEYGTPFEEFRKRQQELENQNP
jgi:methionine-rich copper-binding protein CopC